MDRIVRSSMLIILNIMLFIVLLFTSVQVVAYNNTFFEWHYNNHDIERVTGMSTKSLMEVTNKMMDYLIDDRDTLNMEAIVNGVPEEVFGEREKAHMVDVKVLFLDGKLMRDISFFVVLMSGVLMFFLKKDWFLQWIKGFSKFFIISFGVIGGLGVLFASNFNKYFTIFHELFFDNDLWLLNPKTDILVNMVPEIFFFQITMLIIGLFTISIVLILLLARYGSKKLT